MNMLRKLMNQLVKFILVSGIGWMIDFVIFYILSGIFHFSVMVSNIISTIPAFTFVFLISTRKIFRKKTGNISLMAKYAIYFTYQIIFVYVVSFIGQKVFELLCGANLLSDITLLKLAAKIVITPITICCNFIMLKVLTEKL